MCYRRKEQEMTEKCEPFWIEIELGNAKRKCYLQYDIVNDDLYIELGNWQSVFLCACCDGVEIMQVKCGLRRKKRIFYPSKWLINEWGGDKEIVDALKKCLSLRKEQLPELRKKYFFEMTQKQQDFLNDR